MSLPVIGFMCFLMVGSTLFHRNCDTSSLTSIFQDTMIDVALKCMITCSSESRMDIAIIISIQIYPVGVNINPATFLPSRYFYRFGELHFQVFWIKSPLEIPTYAIFLKCYGFKDTKYDNPNSHDVSNAIKLGPNPKSVHLL